MEEMRGAAMAYYANMPNNQQQMVRSFYESIDRNGDGKVSIQEYSVFLAEKGYKQCMPPNLFKLLDRNNDGTLDFEECVTFFYMITCNRLVICKGCESYLWGLHFLCVECYNVSKEKTLKLQKGKKRLPTMFVKTSEGQEETSNNVKTSKGRVSKREMVKEAVENFQLGYNIGTIGVQTANAVNAGCTIM
ncbi:hypothetical protein RHGRI_003694 [Rhododendron griersonianum]|uniref:EF-hand domain-containing protein n=1 Tax=Rhododendron griersonianum TaxID=479676 RepID=A0AAV6L6X7_9ERIC|nr:hypothetical protein RHGRI_003694 [Rhododendron griersonianum]